MNEIVELLEDLRKARIVAIEVTEHKKAHYDEFLANARTIELFNLKKDADAVVADFEQQVRIKATEQYLSDGIKKQTGYEVKTIININIPDETKARDWCITNFTPALLLNKKIFETAVKNNTVPIDLATISEEPKVYIAMNLDKALKN